MCLFLIDKEKCTENIPGIARVWISAQLVVSLPVDPGTMELDEGQKLNEALEASCSTIQLIRSQQGESVACCYLRWSRMLHKCITHQFPVVLGFLPEFFWRYMIPTLAKLPILVEGARVSSSVNLPTNSES